MNVMIACFTHMKSGFLTTFLFLSFYAHSLSIEKQGRMEDFVIEGA